MEIYYIAEVISVLPAVHKRHC